MILSYSELRQQIQNKVMFPCPDAQVNGSSIDVRLGPVILKEVPPNPEDLDECEILSLAERTPMRTEEINITVEPYLLFPGDFILAVTNEAFDIPLHLTGELRLKSSAARCALDHNLAVWADPGFKGKLTLEIHNVSKYHAVALQAGDRVAQMIFHRHAAVPADRAYAARGAYQGDTVASAAKPQKIKD